MITAREKGRQLELIVGGGDDALSFLVPPINAQAGAELLSEYLGIYLGQVEGEAALGQARNVALLSLGEDVFTRIDDLRWAEQEQVVNAAFFWNVQGGGIESVNTLLRDGIPKAREELLKAVGLWDALSLFATSLSSELESRTSTAGSLDTTTPDGGESSTSPDL